MNSIEKVEHALVRGDLASMSPDERVTYYRQVCESLGLNPLTQPFAYITLQGKLTLYARRDATEQLRKLNRVSVTITGRERLEDLYLVTAQARTPDGRTDESVGAVALAGLKGENLANAIMKAETKAKRRVTLSICGLGFLDESELPADAAPAPEPPPLRQALPAPAKESQALAEAAEEAERQAARPQNVAPADGAELLARLEKKDADLAREGLTKPGLLLAFVRREAERAGWELPPEEWDAEQIAQAVVWVKAFVKGLTKPPTGAEQATSVQLAQMEVLMAKKGVPWAVVASALGVEETRRQYLTVDEVLRACELLDAEPDPQPQPAEPAPAPRKGKRAG